MYIGFEYFVLKPDKQNEVKTQCDSEKNAQCKCVND